MRAAATPSTFHVEGNVGPLSKSLPASLAEIVSPPDAERAIAILKSVFELNPARE
jgi:hypothetical protein